MLSVLIPSISDRYLQQTIDEMFTKATGEVEVIVVLEGYWPKPLLKPQKNLVLIHRGRQHGMKSNINSAVRVAKGDYIMKIDEHCMIAKGFDEALKADCESNWLVVPSRYALDADKWKRGRGPTEYLYLTYPYKHDDLYGVGFHGRKWTGKDMGKSEFYRKESDNKDKLIDDIMAFQGSCYFMHKQHWVDIDGLDETKSQFWQEATELLFKTWLSGGRVIRNKKTWYAHMHKTPKTSDIRFRLSKGEKVRTEEEVADYWMNNKWEKQTRNMDWFVNKFWPIPEWPEDWDAVKNT